MANTQLPKNDGKAGTHSTVGRVWIVVNPIKATLKQGGYRHFRDFVEKTVLERTGQRPIWLETSVKNPGTGQAITALKHKPSVVLAAGGDGTVRAVAAGMAHSNVPLGLLPVGTGNLLARNLELPLDVTKALDVALGTKTKAIDVAWLRLRQVDRKPGVPSEGTLLKEAGANTVRCLPEGKTEPTDDEFAFMAIAGVGFDGETMAQTPAKLKKRVGWPAYVLTSFKSLFIDRMRATVIVYQNKNVCAEKGFGHPNPVRGNSKSPRFVPKKVDAAVRRSHTIGSTNALFHSSQMKKTWNMTSLRARTILFANCGVLPFVTLAPNAKIDDGKLDLIAVDTRAGLFGWAYLGAKILGQNVGVKPVNVKKDAGSIQFRQTPAARVDLSAHYPVQVDGDHIGSAKTLLARVDCKSLLVLVGHTTNW